MLSALRHEIKKFNSRYKKLIHVVKIRLILDGCMHTKSPSTSTSNPRLRRIKLMTNSSFSESFLFGPAFRACKILENTTYNSNFKLFNFNHNYTYIYIYIQKKMFIQFFKKGVGTHACKICCILSLPVIQLFCFWPNPFK